MGALLNANVIKDSGSVDGGTGARVSGCVSCVPSRTGMGTYRLTFGPGDGIDEAQCAILITIRGLQPADRFATVVHTSDTVKTVTLADGAGIPADTDFDFIVVQVPQSQSFAGGAVGPSTLAPVTQFVFRPGGVTGGNVYATCSALAAALNSVEGGKVVFFDDSAVGPNDGELQRTVSPTATVVGSATGCVDVRVDDAVDGVLETLDEYMASQGFTVEVLSVDTRLVVKSADGSSWAITVSDAGVVTTGRV